MFPPELSSLEEEFGSYLPVPTPPRVQGIGPAEGRLLLPPTG